jgi:hypothetical protein
MAHPHPNAPSLKQFVDNAVRQGCVERVVSTTGRRYLKTADNRFAFLPKIADEELILPGKLAELVRNLGVGGYDEFLEQCGYTGDGRTKAH